MKALFELKIDVEITPEDVDIMKQVVDELNGEHFERLNVETETVSEGALAA